MDKFLSYTMLFFGLICIIPAVILAVAIASMTLAVMCAAFSG